eukprot:g612.t1
MVSSPQLPFNHILGNGVVGVNKKADLRNEKNNAKRPEMTQNWGSLLDVLASEAEKIKRQDIVHSRKRVAAAEPMYVSNSKNALPSKPLKRIKLSPYSDSTLKLHSEEQVKEISVCQQDKGRADLPKIMLGHLAREGLAERSQLSSAGLGTWGQPGNKKTVERKKEDPKTKVKGNAHGKKGRHKRPDTKRNIPSKVLAKDMLDKVIHKVQNELCNRTCEESKAEGCGTGLGRGENTISVDDGDLASALRVLSKYPMFTIFNNIVNLPEIMEGLPPPEIKQSPPPDANEEEGKILSADDVVPESKVSIFPLWNNYGFI